MNSALLCLLLVLHAAPPPTSPGDVEPAFMIFAQELEASLGAGDPALLDERVDVERLLARAMRDLKDREGLLEEELRRVRRSGLTLGTKLLGPRHDAFYRLLRVHREAGSPRALFRILSPLGGLNYYEFELARNERGEVVVIDVYPFMAGELLSESFRRVYQMMLAQAGGSSAEGVPAKERGLMKLVPRLWEIQYMADDGRHREVVEAYDALPPVLLREKYFAQMRLKSLSHLEWAEYREGLRAFEKAFPGDPALDMLALDGYLVGKDFASAMKAIERLDRRVKDPYLRYMRGMVKRAEGDVPEARRLFRAAIQAEPTLLAPYVALVALALQEDDYAQAILLFEALEQDAAVDIAKVNGSPEGTGFFSSPEYKNWLRKRGGR